MSEPLPTLHRCAHPGCHELTFLGRCPEHATPADRDLRAALADAVAQEVLARDRWREARERVRRLETQAGIRRA